MMQPADRPEKTFTIDRATEEFIPAITALAHKVALPRLSEKERQEGFLIPYAEVQYMDLARHAEHFYVLSLENRPIGFVIAHSSEKIELFGGEVYLFLKDLQGQPFLVVRQICIDPEFSHQGYARNLYAFLFKRTAEDVAGYRTMVCFIWKSPHNNQRSLKFHGKIGWKELKTYALKDKSGVVGIWTRATGR